MPSKAKSFRLRIQKSLPPRLPGLLFAAFWILLITCWIGPPAFADWAFVVMGDSRDDYKRHQVFPEMIKEISQTASPVQ